MDPSWCGARFRVRANPNTNPNPHPHPNPNPNDPNPNPNQVKDAGQKAKEALRKGAVPVKKVIGPTRSPTLPYTLVPTLSPTLLPTLLPALPPTPPLTLPPIRARTATPHQVIGLVAKATRRFKEHP